MAEPAAVVGTVWLQGAPPAMTDVEETKRDPFCAKVPTKHDEVIVDARGALKDVFVRLAPGSVLAPPGPSGDVVLEHKDCVYTPRVFGLQRGGHVVVRNSDKTLHTVRLLRNTVSPAKTPSWWSQGQPPGTPEIRLPESEGFEGQGVLTFRCDVHPGERAYAVVTDHNFFAVTGDDGTFAIEGFAPGRYVLEAWHPALGGKSQLIDTRGGRRVAVNVIYDATAARRRP